MTLKQLAVRTKKSISGLYSSNNDQASHAPPVVFDAMRPLMDRDYDSFEEFSVSSSGNSSPAKDSPSRRKRFLGSLRSVGSLRSLRSPKVHNDLPVKVEAPCTPVRAMPSLSLNFEVSPPGKPMFDTPSRTTSNSSSMEVHHSTPIAVPMHDRTPKLTLKPFPCNLFTVGTPPKSPAPLQRASVQKGILAASSFDKIGLESTEDSPARQDFVPAGPVTPMPGTNLTLEGVGTPEIVVQSPSAPSMHQTVPGDYFGVPVSVEDIREQRESIVQSEPLPADDADFDEIFVAAAAIVPPVARRPLPEKIFPVQSMETVVPNEKPRFDSCKGSLHEHTSPRSSSDSDGLQGTMAYIIWNDRTTGEEHTAEQKCCPSARSLHATTDNDGDLPSPCIRTGSTGSTSDEWSDPTECTDTEEHSLSAIDEEKVSSKVNVVVEEESTRSSIDDREELENIIRSYARPMRHQMQFDLDDLLVEEEEAYLADGVNDEVKADVALSLRVMNRSLGG